MSCARGGAADRHDEHERRAERAGDRAERVDGVEAAADSALRLGAGVATSASEGQRKARAPQQRGYQCDDACAREVELQRYGVAMPVHHLDRVGPRRRAAE